MKLTSITASDALSKEFAKEILSQSPLLTSYIEFFAKPGNAISVRKGTNGEVAGSTRAIGSDYATKDVKPEYTTEARKFIGDTIRLDRAYEKVGYDIASEMKSQLKKHARNFALKFHYYLINGDAKTTATEFDGLKNLVKNSRVVKAAVNGLVLKLGNSDAAKSAQQQFLETLDQTIGKCDGLKKVIILNAQVKARLNAIARDYIEIAKNEFGIPISYYNSIPIIEIGEYFTAENTSKSIIDFDETCGTSIDSCASIYVVSFEEEDGLSFATTKGGFTVYPTKMVDNNLQTTHELIIDSMLIRDGAISKLEGLKLQ